MSARIVYVSRVCRLPLIGTDGGDVARVVDVVIGTGSRPPRAVGFVAAVQRRQVFVGAGRVGEVDALGLRLRRGAINMRQFEVREGERLAVRELMGRRVRGRRVVDVGLAPQSWEVVTVALGARRVPGLPHAPDVLDWSEAGELFADAGSAAREAAKLDRLHPAEMAATLRALPPSRRRTLAEALDDDRLADLLEELDEEEQIRLVEGLGLDRLARVLEEMEADDAADLLGELPDGRRAELLGAMDPGEAAPVRRLLRYAADTAGGLMTPEPVILGPQATVAEALAHLRAADLSVPLAAQAFVCQPPFETPTGRFLGVVGFQRLLREAPGKPVGRCLEDGIEPLAPDAADRRVAERLAAYDIVAMPVCDEQGRLLGAVTVDDVLDRTLPADWRHSGLGR